MKQRIMVILEMSILLFFILSVQTYAVEQEISHGSLPELVNRLKWSGDLRLRYQGDFFDDENALFVKPGQPD